VPFIRTKILIFRTQDLRFNWETDSDEKEIGLDIELDKEIDLKIGLNREVHVSSSRDG